MKKKKICSLALVFALLMTLVLPAGTSAAADSGTIDVSLTSQPLPAGVTYDSTNHLFTIGTDANGSTITVTGTTMSNTIAVAAGVTELILNMNGVSIASTAAAPIHVESGATVEIGLTEDTTNTLTAGYGYAGLSVPSGATVTIEDMGTGGTSGMLNVTGGEMGAGIGGGMTEGWVGVDAGTINLYGGVITATSGTGGAGIGGGAGAFGNNGGHGGQVTISGGTVTADAIGNSYAAGIGGGNGGTGGDGGTVTINGGTVFARGSNLGGAGIGGGEGHNGGTSGVGGTITIASPAEVTAISSGVKPAIDAVAGSGTIINASLDSALDTTYYLKCSNGLELTLPDSYRNFAFSPVTEASQTVRANYSPTVFWGSIVTRADSSVNIPVMDLSVSPGLVTAVMLLVNSTIDVSKGDMDQTLPAGVTYENNVFTINAIPGSPTRTITVVGNNSSSHNTIAVDALNNLTLILSNVTIAGTGNTGISGVAPINLSGGSVKLQLADGTANTLIASSGSERSGIHVPFGSTLTINGNTGSLIVNGDPGSGGAGIGANGTVENGGTININGGTINATGGYIGAGMGGGGNTGTGHGSGGIINISGGTVTAKGGYYSAGIGGGGNGGAGGNISITGGTVNATGGLSGAGIGGGVNGAGGTVSISGSSTVVAAIGGTNDGAGIGGGNNGTSGTLNITGTPVIMAASYSGGTHKPAIDVTSGTGSVINARLNTAISTTLTTYLKCGTNKLPLPKNYLNFAFSTAAPVSAYSDQDCNSQVGVVVTNPGEAVNLPVTNLSAAPANVTAVKLLSFYPATVTVKKDGSPWTNSTPVIRLSTSASSLTEEVPGTLEDNVYNFTGLTASTYYVWDTTDTGNNIYTGKSVTSSSSTTVDYYTIGFSVTDVGGTASGSTISVTYDGQPIDTGDIVPGGKALVMSVVGHGASTYDIQYSGLGAGNGANGGISVSSSTYTLTINPLVEDDNIVWTVTGLTYTAAINLQKDGSLWTGSGKNITLQLASETPTATTEAGGVFTASVANGTWKILADGSDTGATVFINNAPALQELDYYTVTLAQGTGISNVIGGGTYLSGSNASINATVSSGYIWSKWTQTTGGASVSATQNYTIANITAPHSYTANATASGPAPIISTNSLSGGTVDTPYSQNLVAVTTTFPLTWSIVSGALPANLSLNTSNGVISGTPTVAGTNTFTIQAANPNGSVTKALSITIEDIYPLTVNLNGGSGSTVSGSYAAGAAVSIDAGTKSGYTFSGWTSSSGGTFANAGNASTTFTMPENATTITAGWTGNPTTYPLTVNLNGGSGSTVSGSYAAGAAVSIDAGTKSGYTFSGWTSTSGGTFENAGNASTTFTMPENATTITAAWTANPTTYPLTVNLNGGSGSTVSSSYAAGAAVSIDAGTKSGYTFSGWTSSSGGTFANAGNASTTFTMPENTTTITAGWTANPTTYPLTVNLNGGSGSTVSSSYAAGAAVSIDAGTKSGYTFSGWTSSSGGTFANAGNASTTFTMPGNATTITAAWTGNSSSGAGGISSTTPTNNNTIVIVDGEDHAIGTETKADSGTTATVDQGKLSDSISIASDSSSVIFPVSANNSVTAQLVVKNVEDMAQKDMILTVKTGGVSYNLKTAAIDTENITAALGTTHTEDIPFNVTISYSDAAAVGVTVSGATIMVSPVEFTVTAVYNGKTVAVDTFASFVDRTVEITAEQAARITTAVVIRPDGTTYHVPTKVTVIDGKYYSVINSLTNSTYTLVWHPVEFADVTTSWAKDTINDLGSRMIVSGVGSDNYKPNRKITRAEFAAIVVRALGLDTGMGTSSFTDVSSSAWYCGYIQTAAGYGIIAGYGDGRFGPSDTITREQAMTIIARAMKITKLAPSLTASQIASVLSKYKDASEISDYAKESVAACSETGVVQGRPNNMVASKDFITRAEVAAIVQRMLQKSGLI